MLPDRKQILFVSDSIALYSADMKEKQREQNSLDLVLVFGWGF